MMGDLQLGVSLGTYASSAQAIERASQQAGDSAIVMTIDGDHEVFSLTRSGRHGDLLGAAVAGSNASLVMMTSNFIPSCTHFVIDNGRVRVVVKNVDIATFIRQEQAKAGFFDRPGVEQVGFWEMARLSSEMYGGIGPNELAALRQLCRAIRSAIGVSDAAQALRVQSLAEALETQCGAADEQTLSNILVDVKVQKVTKEYIEVACAALCRSHRTGVLDVAKNLDAALRKLPNSVQNANNTSQFSMTYREFSQKLEGSNIRDDAYENPTAMLSFGQNDFLSVTRQDRARCGAASLVAAALLFGPDTLATLADTFGVAVDVQHPTAGPLHLLMEQIYVQTRTIARNGLSPVPGLDELQVNELVSALFGSTPAPDMLAVESFVPSDAIFHLMAIGGSAADHAVLLFRDPKTGKQAIYEPEVFGQAARVFRDDDELSSYFQDRPLHSHPGKVMVVAAV